MTIKNIPFRLNNLGLKERFYLGPLGLLIVLAILSSVFIYVGNAHKLVWQQVSQQYDEVGVKTNQTIDQFHSIHDQLIDTVFSLESGASNQDIYENGIEILAQLEQVQNQLNDQLLDAESLVYPLIDSDSLLYDQELNKLSQAFVEMNQQLAEYHQTVTTIIDLTTVDIAQAKTQSLFAIKGYQKVNKSLNTVRAVIFSSIQTSMDSKLEKYNQLYASIWFGLLVFTGFLFYICFRISKLTIATLDYIHRSLLDTARLVSNKEVIPTDKQHASSIAQIESAVDTFSTVVVELNKQREQIQLEQQKSQAANQAKSNFLSSMSHEFRTPLNQVLGYTQLLEQTSLDQEQRESLQTIKNGGDTLLAMIEKLLLLTELEDDNVSLLIEPTTIKSALDKSIELVVPLAENKAVTIKRLVQHGYPDIAVDQRALTDLLNIILNNAIIYNKVNGKVEITISEENKGYLRFNIKDTGTGIEPNSEEVIFQPFERLATANSSILGAGVGLAIAKKLTTLMHGNIGFTSQLNVGSTFWVEFPIAR
ncbi:hypothetical protein A9Q78_08710 [Methylophaga sp. 41_12_T18]|nr:hypothetical protein A9Q78_08710 [Methylophaga sp. 41_12_T18]